MVLATQILQQARVLTLILMAAAITLQRTNMWQHLFALALLAMVLTTTQITRDNPLQFLAALQVEFLDILTRTNCFTRQLQTDKYTTALVCA